jgi:hypothetical protein
MRGLPPWDVETLEAQDEVRREREFVIKDSGQREKFAGGMVRDTTTGKVEWALVADGPMLRRWAMHLTKGAIKYAKRNWLKASGDAEYERFRESAFRHFMQWYNEERDEDHAAAVIFNINGAEYVREQKGE